MGPTDLQVAACGCSVDALGVDETDREIVRGQQRVRHHDLDTSR